MKGIMAKATLNIPCLIESKFFDELEKFCDKWNIDYDVKEVK